MSSEGSVTSTASRIRQFGLYRTIDARTDDFLRSSRRRQIRQGCACAAISTAITVTVVVVILLIYEYAIAVEWSLVQNKKSTPEVVKNQPIADRLDRSYFGFDQDYFEKMPLLINALQENNYLDPMLERTDLLHKRKRLNATVINTTTKRTLRTSVGRKTIPTPFHFENRHPTPLPFSKTYGSRSWVERYRNEERLKNIRQIIKYLENTIHAKVGDMHARATEKDIDFTGAYIEPVLINKGEDSYKLDLQPTSADNLKKRHLNHLADPLFHFKPENPGDVNLLADDFFRFSPATTPSISGNAYEYPMFRQIPLKNRNCHGNKCKEIKAENNKLLQSFNTTNQTELPITSTTKSFSVLLNLYPTTSKSENKEEDVLTTTHTLNKLYPSTARPLVQFKRKSNIPYRRIYTPYKRPRYLSNLINKNLKFNTTKETKLPEFTKSDSQMAIHLKMFKKPSRNAKNETIEKNSSTVMPFMITNSYTIRAPIEFSTSRVEDYHVGSSGYIPIADEPEKSLPKVTTMFNFFDTSTEHWNSINSQPSSVVKFNIQDAKVPNHYINFHKKVSKENISRRKSIESIDHTDLLKDIKTHKNINDIQMNLSKPVDTNLENSTLIIKLKNDFRNNVKHSTEANEEDITTPIWIHVPQINGHYRSINQNSRNVNKWLNSDPESDRKSRLAKLVSGLSTHVPMYVEIKRSNGKSLNTEEIITATTPETKN